MKNMLRLYLAFCTRHQRRLMRIGFAFSVLAACMALSGCAVPVWISDAESLVPLLAASATAVLSFLGGLSPATAALVQKIIMIIQDVSAGLSDIATMIAEYKSNPNDTLLQKIEGVANLVVSNLQQVMSDTGIPASVAMVIQKWAQLALSQLEAWLAVLPNIKVAMAEGRVEAMERPADDRLLSHAELKQELEAIFTPATGDAEVDAALEKVPAF
jgi:hypothetical protein